jgi:DNA adenine methylase
LVRIRHIPAKQHWSAGAEPAGPIVKWAGGKRGLLEQLRPLAPAAFNTYYEPFLGGAAMFLSLQPDTPLQAVLGDANDDLMAVYRTVRDDLEAVIARLDGMQPHVLEQDYYYALRAQDAPQLSAVERSARFIFLNKTCYNGLYRVNRAGRFNVPFGRYARPPMLYDRDNLQRVSRRLQAAKLECGDFAATLDAAGADDFAYLDPPYAPSTSTANFTKYTHASFTARDQQRLAEVVRDLTRRNCRVLLSNSDTPLVRDLYAGYHVEVVHAARNINSDINGRSKVRELAILNY